MNQSCGDFHGTQPLQNTTMKSILLFSLTLITLVRYSLAQQNSAAEKPKLVVGIVVDQMRYDFLWRFWDLYGEGGFKKLVSDGFLCRNMKYNYMLTTTAPGHASIYSGTTPALHGIVDNMWYDRNSGQKIYVVSDPKTIAVGNEMNTASSSPFRLLTSTITDELKLASKNSKVIGIALKDRSAIMPAGHSPDGAFWFDSKTGNWISSSWYMKELPPWVKQFNDSHKRDNYLAVDWKLLLPRAEYSMCTNDTVVYEEPWSEESLPVFPHRLQKGKYNMIPLTPFGNTMTKDLAIESIKGEQLGKRNETDFLCISFSSTDIVGHSFGPYSLETADCYVRLDRDLEALLKFIDDYVGRENALIFLTADHGVALNPQFANDARMIGRYVNSDTLIVQANKLLSSSLGTGKWIEGGSSQQLYLNNKLIAESKISRETVVARTCEFLLSQPGILCVNAPNSGFTNCAPFIQQSIMNGYMPSRSGDILYSLSPGWVEWHTDKGTSHGTSFSYDSHVPLIWYGWKIVHGTSADYWTIPDIAPTLANWLKIPYPSGCTGNPITGILMKK